MSISITLTDDDALAYLVARQIGALTGAGVQPHGKAESAAMNSYLPAVKGTATGKAGTDPNAAPAPAAAHEAADRLHDQHGKKAVDDAPRGHTAEAAKQSAAAATAAPTPAPATDAAQPDLAAVRKAIHALGPFKDGRSAAIALLAAFGATSAQNLDPKHFAAFIEQSAAKVAELQAAG